MARFRATIRGQRGEASRLGGRASGIQATVNGWDVGVEVDGHGGPDLDAFDLYATGGSNGRHGRTWIGRVRLVDGKPTFLVPAQVKEAA